MSPKIPHCPQCHPKDFVKNGKDYGKQRYRRKLRKYNFTVPKMGKGIGACCVRLCPRLYLEGLGPGGIECIVGVGHVRVMNWVKEIR